MKNKDPQIEKLIDQNKKLTAQVATLQVELQQQKDLVAALLKKLYGTKSEKLSPDQLLLTFLKDDAKKPTAVESPEEGPAAKAPTKKKRAPRTNKLADSLKTLPTTQRLITHPAVKKAPQDYRLIGEETSERLHISPATFTREIITRQTHVKKADPDAAPITPPLAPSLLPGSVLTPSLGAHLLSEKFCYHQPFYRQEWKLRATHGIELTRNLMCSWHNHLAEQLHPLYKLLAAKIRASDYIQVDETPIKYQQPGSGKTQQGYLWTYHHPQHGALYDWHPSRANTCLDNILIGPENKSSFNGHLQSDGLRAYRTFRERHNHLQITPVSCLAHIRRKFTEATGDHPKITHWILLQIGKIYGIESRLKAQHAGPLQRQKIRWLETRRIYDHLKKLITHLQKTRHILPKSALGKALHYAHDQWPHLEPCFLDGQIEFDNNLTEGAIRPTKLGMKNWMFIGNEETGWRSAVIYTFVEQVRRHGKDPFAYFEWVFEKLMHDPSPEEHERLLPENWIKLQREEEALNQSQVA